MEYNEFFQQHINNTWKIGKTEMKISELQLFLWYLILARITINLLEENIIIQPQRFTNKWDHYRFLDLLEIVVKPSSNLTLPP